MINFFKNKLPRVILIGFVLLFSLSGFTKQKDPPAEGQFRFRTVIIDAGHGGKDPGAHGVYSTEKKVTLAIAKKLEAAIQEQLPDVKTVMTRTTDDFIPLNERALIANVNKGNLFISIHCNSSPAVHGTGKGVMLLVYGFHRSEEQREAIRENASIFIEKDYKQNYDDYDPNSPAGAIILNNYVLKYRKQSILFGSLLNDQFKNSDNRRSLGVNEQGVLVLAHSAMPAVLIETGFINNVEEEEFLNSEEGQNQIVRTIVRSLKEYKERISTK